MTKSDQIKGDENDVHAGDSIDYAKQIGDVFVRCLFNDGEPTDGAVMVQGVTSGFGFHPGARSSRVAVGPNRMRVRSIARPMRRPVRFRRRRRGAGREERTRPR